MRTYGVRMVAVAEVSLMRLAIMRCMWLRVLTTSMCGLGVSLRPGLMTSMVVTGSSRCLVTARMLWLFPVTW